MASNLYSEHTKGARLAVNDNRKISNLRTVMIRTQLRAGQSLRMWGNRMKPMTTRNWSSRSPAEDIVLLRAEQDIQDIKWIQELLDKTEGGGYMLKHAGMLGHSVAWGDQDSFGHVNNVVYLKWFETARVNMFRGFINEHPNQGFETFMDPVEVGPIVRSVELAWRYPIQFPDTITVIHKLLPLTKPDRFELKGVVVSHKAKKVAARIHEQIVTVDYSNGGIKAEIPETVKSAFETRLKEQENST